MDVCIRQSLTQLAARRMWGTIDIPHILLGLLNIIFKSDFSNGKSYMQWKRRQVILNFAKSLIMYYGWELSTYNTYHIRHLHGSPSGFMLDYKNWFCYLSNERWSF